MNTVHPLWQHLSTRHCLYRHSTLLLSSYQSPVSCPPIQCSNLLWDVKCSPYLCKDVGTVSDFPLLSDPFTFLACYWTLYYISYIFILAKRGLYKGTALGPSWVSLALRPPASVLGTFASLLIMFCPAGLAATGGYPLAVWCAQSKTQISFSEVNKCISTVGKQHFSTMGTKSSKIYQKCNWF